ncbi:hypothetical protein EVAR_62135_1 [Eumeta japonica]|uniref:Uncharacterized protein n=1 Tax=Eumeta variegata TaxID=151549 RepID=A0A4C1ZDR2_EUMVA|nr:hypothetical protein EVAR_62135_1 [Eumeta japonica]
MHFSKIGSLVKIGSEKLDRPRRASRRADIPPPSVLTLYLDISHGYQRPCLLPIYLSYQHSVSASEALRSGLCQSLWGARPATPPPPPQDISYNRGVHINSVMATARRYRLGLTKSTSRLGLTYLIGASHVVRRSKLRLFYDFDLRRRRQRRPRPMLSLV